MVKEYDYIVIGGGSGGIASANRAAMHGAKVILFEGKEVGGTCVNVGCVPKKVMWYGAQVAETLHRYAGEYGFDVTINKFDFATLKANRQAYIDRIHGSYERGFDSNGVERVYEYARFVDPHTVEVAGERYTAPHILIATGGHALYPNIPGSEYGITSDGFFELDEVPKRTAVIGAGYIAVEVAGVLNALGSDTHLFVRKDRPLRTFDKDIVDVLVDEMAKSGPTLHTHANATEVVKNADDSLTISFDNGETITVDCLIWAIGRAANTSGFGLEKTGVKLTEKGTIYSDEFENTSVPGIYALGDVTGKLDLNQLVFGLLGVAMIILGNIMPKLRMNSVVGLRSVWSMKNETAWKKSQRFGGISFIVSGIIIIMVCFLTKGISCFWWTMSIVAILLIVDTYYTYTLSKKY